MAARARDRAAAVRRAPVVGAGGHRQAGRRRARARQRLHRRHRGGAPAQADDGRRRDPAEPVPAAHRAHHRRAARRRRCCPTYEVGGDWFDFVENRDGAWLAIADAAGNGPTAAGLGASALGALRAARRSGQDLVRRATTMDEVVRALGNPDFYVTALLARWHAPTATLTWINCGHPPALPRRPRRPLHRARRAGPPRPRRRRRTTPTYETSASRSRHASASCSSPTGSPSAALKGGGRFGIDGVRRAVAAADAPTAAATAMAIHQAVTECSTEPLEDDATLVVLAVD